MTTLKAFIPSGAKPALRYILSRYKSSGIYPLRYALETRRLLRSADRPLKLHLGCGPKILPGWLNIDVTKFQGAAVMRLPSGLKRFSDNSADFVYCSHMVEHIEYPTEVLALAREIYRILVPNGVFRFVVPGIERIIRAYVADDLKFFEEQKHHHHPVSCTTKMECLMYALQQHGNHKYGYDFETAKKFLDGAGFVNVTNSEYNASARLPLRIDYRGENLSLFVEATKPPPTSLQTCKPKIAN